MRVICAWCQQEGRSGLLRVREPLDDTTDTHGICDRHQQAVFETFPAASFPGTRWLFIVPASDVACFQQLTTLLAEVPEATVILDRRRGERRRATTTTTPDRRRLERRIRRPEKNSLGYALVKFTIQHAPGADVSGSSGPPTVTSRG